jgi:uncharacterized protein with ATP-grasp and redox domains
VTGRKHRASVPWGCDIPGSFAHRTCTERWPAIVRATATDVADAAGPLHALADEVAAGAVRPLAATTPEAPRWNVVEPLVGRPWTALPWYVGESFLYARIREAVGFAATRQDPFLPAKLREERSLPVAADEDPADEATLERALWRSLWGNRGDLSLPAARRYTGSDVADLVADDRIPALELLRRARHVVIVLDNAGGELVADLALARLLAARGVAVTLCPKDAPFFVSDALFADIERLAAGGHGTGGAAVLVDPFFTGPDFLQTAVLPPRLQALLGSADVLVVKGDCNYRRLVGDVPWDPDDTRSLGDVVDLPVAVIALRTLKAEVLVGAAPEAVQRAMRDPTWLVDGRRGLVQVALPRR